MYTKHGHHIPGTSTDDQPENVARCGGPERCANCALEAFRYLNQERQKKELENLDLEFTPFVRKPFEVEAVQVTEENIVELAPLIGTLEEKDGKPFIQVDRQRVPNVWRVFPGFYVTRMGGNIRCYSRKVFFEQFQVPEETQTEVDLVELPQSYGPDESVTQNAER